MAANDRRLRRQAIQFPFFGVEVSMSTEDVPLPITSSTEPDWASDAVACYRDVLQALDAAGVPCAVGGAFALHEHTGIWRTTKDLDFLIEAGEVPRALASLREAGFETWIEDPVWLAKASRGEYFVDLISGVGNATLPVERSWIERALPAEILGMPCRVLAAEEMIASKVFVTRRERFDGSDVVHLIHARGRGLDWARVLHLLEQHWQMLYWSLVLFAYVYPSETDMVPEQLWVELSQRLTREALHPRPDAVFRGSLIDPLMFAIDVDEWGKSNLYREYCEEHPSLLTPGEEPEDRKGDREEAA
jgi:hypothetical protein